MTEYESVEGVDCILFLDERPDGRSKQENQLHDLEQELLEMNTRQMNESVVVVGERREEPLLCMGF